MEQSSQFITLLNIPLTIQFAGGRDGKLGEPKWQIINYLREKACAESFFFLFFFMCETRKSWDIHNTFYPED